MSQGKQNSGKGEGGREGESERERKQEIKPANDQSTIANLPILYATFDGIIVSYNDDPAIEPQAGFLISG